MNDFTGRLAALLAVPLLLGACADASNSDETPHPEVFLDGDFSDWVGAQVIVDDPSENTGESNVDLTRIMGLDDPAWLFLSLEVGTVANMQAMVGTIHILVDADADTDTGGDVFDMAGVDFSLDLSRLDLDMGQGSTHGAGFSLRLVGPDGLGGHRSSYELRVMGAPTYAADRFELRIARGGAPDGFARMGKDIRAKLVCIKDGEILDETDVGTYTFSTVAGPDPFQVAADPLGRVPGATRVAQWNVAEGSFRDPVGHAALLGAVQPDVIMLDEVFGNVTEGVMRDFFALPPLRALGEWEFVIGSTGGRQKTVVAARGHSIRPEISMASVEYPTGSIAKLRLSAPQEYHWKLDREIENQVAATGAWVDLDGTDVLFVPLDLESGGFHGSPSDALRDLQSRTIRTHVLEAIDGSGVRAPTVVGGDFNLVGSPRPLTVLRTGLDTDGGDLQLSDGRRLGERTRATWRDTRKGPFAPGRLDFTLFSSAALEQVGGFIFATEDLSDAQLDALGLIREESARSSDHLIVVTDLRGR